jgi:hypothetical protein
MFFGAEMDIIQLVLTLKDFVTCGKAHPLV